MRGKWSKRKQVRKEKKDEERGGGEREKKEGSKSDFAVQWCLWIIMKMKATESGSKEMELRQITQQGRKRERI